MSSRYAVIIAVVALIFTAGCLGAAPTDGVTAPGARAASVVDASTDLATISVSASGEVSADPDLARISLAVERTEETADAARDAVADDVNRMRDALRDAGVPDDQVQTVSYGIFPEYDYFGPSRELIGYRASHAFEVEVAPGEAGSVIDAAVGAGATRVTGVAFTLTEETRRDLRTQALGLAMADARDDADTLAESAGVSVTTVHTISTADVGVIPVRESLEAGAEARAPTVLEPGPVTVTANVQVTYRIGPPDGQSA